MKLIFLYGPPATGKLTVARELAGKTGYKIFHNQLTVDLCESLFEFGSDIFFDLLFKFRADMLEAAAKAKLRGVISTFCYSHKDDSEDDEFISKILKGTRKYGAKVYFVHLYCDKKELAKRVSEESRNEFGKLKDPDKLSCVMDEHDFFTPIPFVENLEIDNTRLSKEEVVDRIMDYISE
ncbi:AAA family ATPase [Patescibacteria group bacterium]|nr:AAA family ATPase [Patescibacteria group bacterium]